MIFYKQNVFRIVIMKSESWLWGLIPAVSAALISVGLILLENYVPSVRDFLHTKQLASSQLVTLATMASGIIIGVRTNQAYNRYWEASGLLQQMRAEWFDSANSLVTFSFPALATKRDDVMLFRHTLVRLMSLCHGSALEEIKDVGADFLDTIDTHGLDSATLRHLSHCKGLYNRVEVLLHMIQILMLNSMSNGVLAAPAPIVSRVFQTLSKGYAHLLNAKKIHGIPFPFPYAHLLSWLLLGHCILSPVLITVVTGSYFWGPILSALFVGGMFSLNNIAVELENPFGTDPNDLPLAWYQSEMNKSLLMLLQPNTDILTSVGSEYVRDFSVLRTQKTGARVSNKRMTWLPSDEEGGFRRYSRLSDLDEPTFVQAMDAKVASGKPEERNSVAAPPMKKQVTVEVTAGSLQEPFMKEIVSAQTALSKCTSALETQVEELARNTRALHKATESSGKADEVKPTKGKEPEPTKKKSKSKEPDAAVPRREEGGGGDEAPPGNRAPYDV